MCVLAMSFSVVYYPLLLFFALPLFALCFAPGRGCFIAATLRQLTAMSYTTAVRPIIDTIIFRLANGAANCAH